MPPKPRFFNLKIDTEHPISQKAERKLKHSTSRDSYFASSDPSSSGYFKAIEKSIDAGKLRIITPYEKNHTAALHLPIDSETLAKKATDPLELLEECRDLIIEHAARRVDLFFYTLIAYHNKDHTPELGATRLQHGMGRRSGEFVKLTEACHSSLSPSLLDKTIKDSHSDEEKTPSYAIKKSILSNTHFLDSLNSTVELPHFVNELDDELENFTHCRKMSIAILNEVAQGNLSVIKGFKQFFIMLNDAFSQIEELKPLTKFGQPYLLRDTADAPKDLRSTLVTLQKFGTFHEKWSESSKFVHPPYLELLLRLTPKEKDICQHSEKTRERIYQKKITAIQREILTTPSACDYGTYTIKRSFSHD